MPIIMGASCAATCDYGVILKTVPQPTPPSSSGQRKSPPSAATPYKLPAESIVNPEEGNAPSDSSVKSYSTVSLPFGSNLKTTPQPPLQSWESPPPEVTP